MSTFNFLSKPTWEIHLGSRQLPWLLPRQNVFFSSYLGNSFAEVIAFKQNVVISVKLFSFNLLNIFIDNFIEICNFTCSLLSFNI